MKLRVVGWTDYDYFEFKEGENTWAVRMALVDDIKKNGYLFSGWDHQECGGCAPVFNDGKMRRFSQRGFGDIMAEAHGETGYMAYAQYAFRLNPKACNYPQNEVYRWDVQAEKDLAETFVLDVDEQFFNSAPTVEHIVLGELKSTKKTLKLADLPQLRYIDKGDTLVLECNGKSKAFGILDVDRGRDLTQEQRIDYMVKMSYNGNRKECENAQKEFDVLPIIITLQVKQRRKWQLNG